VWFLIRPVSILFGAEDEMLEDCVTYGSIILIGTASFMLQNVFQSFLITAEKPKLGLAVTVAAGVTNMFLDWLFMAIFEWGVAGAAIATTISQIVGGIIPLIYFLRPNSSQLRLVKPVFDFRALGQACANGSSEMMSSISASIVNMLYNFQLMKYVGNSGVAAYGVIMYVNFIFVAVFIGYSIGVAPIVGYHYGAGNHPELKNLFRKSLVIIGSSGVIITALAILLSPELASIFVGYNPELTELTQRGLVIYSCAFIFTGFNIFGSAFFTALNNGLVSAVISFLRTLLFQASSVMLLPIFFDLDGIWFAIIVAEFCCLVLTTIFIVKNRSKYKYY